MSAFTVAQEAHFLPSPASYSDFDFDGDEAHTSALSPHALVGSVTMTRGHENVDRDRDPKTEPEPKPKPEPERWSPSSTMAKSSSLLQPRVAVVLGVAETWHPLLFVCRLLSIGPAIYFGLPLPLRLLAQLHMLLAHAQCADGAAALQEHGLSSEQRMRLTETCLAIIWCGASACLSFFFTDCVMSRWLVNYTPQATIVRLLTTNVLNAYLTSWVLYLAGGQDDPQLLLPSWIWIATTLTLLYHVMQRKINIRKETRVSINVFSIASFISMVALLVHLQASRIDYSRVPLIMFAERAWHCLGRGVAKAMEYGNANKNL